MFGFVWNRGMYIQRAGEKKNNVWIASSRFIAYWGEPGHMKKILFAIQYPFQWWVACVVNFIKWIHKKLIMIPTEKIKQGLN